jgi:hypothetical protein
MTGSSRESRLQDASLQRAIALFSLQEQMPAETTSRTRLRAMDQAKPGGSSSPA